MPQFVYIFFFLLCFNGLSSPILGQKLITKFEHFGVQDGFRGGTPLEFHEDIRGFIWIVTSTDVNRFDGYDFHTILAADIKQEKNIFQKIASDRIGNI